MFFNTCQIGNFNASINLLYIYRSVLAVYTYINEYGVMQIVIKICTTPCVRCYPCPAYFCFRLNLSNTFSWNNCINS